MLPIYFVSLGPGDPELITIQARRILLESHVIYTPVAVAPNGRRSSKAQEMLLSVGIRAEQLALYDLPMSKKRDAAQQAYESVARAIVEERRSGSERKIAVVAEGDSGFYSSSAYIGDLLVSEGIELVQLAGVPAFIACNALLGGQLVCLEEQLRVIPGQATDAEWEEAWRSKHSIVIMKGSLCQKQILQAMERYPERHWSYYEYVGYDREWISTDLEAIKERTFPYFSIIISKPPR